MDDFEVRGGRRIAENLFEQIRADAKACGITDEEFHGYVVRAKQSTTPATTLRRLVDTHIRRNKLPRFGG